jgi:hypothetical protein
MSPLLLFRETPSHHGAGWAKPHKAGHGHAGDDDRADDSNYTFEKQDRKRRTNGTEHNADHAFPAGNILDVKHGLASFLKLRDDLSGS